MGYEVIVTGFASAAIWYIVEFNDGWIDLVICASTLFLSQTSE